MRATVSQWADSTWPCFAWRSSPSAAMTCTGQLWGEGCGCIPHPNPPHPVGPVLDLWMRHSPNSPGAHCRRSVSPWQRRSPWILLTLGATPPFTWLQGCGREFWQSWWLSYWWGPSIVTCCWDRLGYIYRTIMILWYVTYGCIYIYMHIIYIGKRNCESFP